MLTVIAIPILRATYIWIIFNEANKRCVIIDPGEAKPAIDFIRKKRLAPEAILLTHHHLDHSGGVNELVNCYSIPVYEFGQKNKNINLDKIGLKFEAIETPGHTLDHIAYYGNGMLFCGDTLFAGGCGRVFEGTMEQMFNSLNKLKQLPDSTLVYCSHEYTLPNLKFAQTIEPNNQAIKKRIAECKEFRRNKSPTLPSTIKIEKATNPFLRCEEPEVIQAAYKHSGHHPQNPLETFIILRNWKDGF